MRRIIGSGERRAICAPARGLPNRHSPLRARELAERTRAVRRELPYAVTGSAARAPVRGDPAHYCAVTIRTSRRGRRGIAAPASSLPALPRSAAVHARPAYETCSMCSAAEWATAQCASSQPRRAASARGRPPAPAGLSPVPSRRAPSPALRPPAPRRAVAAPRRPNSRTSAARTFAGVGAAPLPHRAALRCRSSRRRRARSARRPAAWRPARAWRTPADSRCAARAARRRSAAAACSRAPSTRCS